MLTSLTTIDDIDGTTLGGIDNVNDAVLVPIRVEPLYVSQVIVHGELVSFGKYGANVSISGTHIVDAPTPVAIVPLSPAHDHFVVCVNADETRFVLIVIGSPSCVVPLTDGVEALGIVVNVSVFEAYTVPADTPVAKDADALTQPDPSAL